MIKLVTAQYFEKQLKIQAEDFLVEPRYDQDDHCVVLVKEHLYINAVDLELHALPRKTV